MDKPTSKGTAKSNRKEFYEWVDEKTKVISNPTQVYKTITFIEKGFPEELFKQWRKQFNDQFNDIYWAKIWNDHIKAQAYDKVIEGAVQYVKQENNTTADSVENESSGPQVFGDGE